MAIRKLNKNEYNLVTGGDLGKKWFEYGKKLVTKTKEFVQRAEETTNDVVDAVGGFTRGVQHGFNEVPCQKEEQCCSK